MINNLRQGNISLKNTFLRATSVDRFSEETSVQSVTANSLFMQLCSVLSSHAGGTNFLDSLKRFRRCGDLFEWMHRSRSRSCRHSGWLEALSRRLCWQCKVELCDRGGCGPHEVDSICRIDSLLAELFECSLAGLASLLRNSPDVNRKPSTARKP